MSSLNAHHPSNRVKLAPVRRCDDVELQRIKASPFLGTQLALVVESACPEPLWLNDMLDLDYNISRHSRLLISVGCNTAVDAMEVAGALSHNGVFYQTDVDQGDGKGHETQSPSSVWCPNDE